MGYVWVFLWFIFVSDCDEENKFLSGRVIFHDGFLLNSWLMGFNPIKKEKPTNPNAVT